MEKENLIRNVGLFRRLLAHRMHSQRGSASIAEWIEKAIYLYHDYEFEYKTPGEPNSRSKADLDVYCRMYLGEYIKIYERNTSLSRISIDEFASSDDEDERASNESFQLVQQEKLRRFLKG